MRKNSFIDPLAIIKAAELLLTIAEAENECERSAFDFDPCDDLEEPCFGFDFETEGLCQPKCCDARNGFHEEAPLPEWRVGGFPPEDKNKVFGINIRVDEPRREDYRTRLEFERDHAKFDRLVDAAEACDWENKDNEAPLHKVNAVRRRLEDGPVMNLNLVGETHWW